MQPKEESSSLPPGKCCPKKKPILDKSDVFRNIYIAPYALVITICYVKTRHSLERNGDFWVKLVMIGTVIPRSRAIPIARPGSAQSLGDVALIIGFVG
jgi:hypothetical protein